MTRRRRERGEVRAADGTRIAFHTHSHEGPLVVLTNGIGTTENFWKHLIADLVWDHRVVHWDYRGHGSSSLSASGRYDFRTQADDLAAVTRAVLRPGDAPPVHVGFSMGVAVILELYRDHPELVRGLGLIAGAPDAPGKGTGLLALPGAFDAVRALVAGAAPVVRVLSPAIRRVLRSRVPYSAGRALGILQKTAPRDDIEYFLHGIASMDPTAYWSTMIALFNADASDVLPRITVPVTIVAAANDVLMPLAQVARMRAALPNATYTQVEHAGHAGLLEQGPAMVDAVRAFLERVEGA